MHICYICSEYPRIGRTHGGIGRKLQHIAKRLVALGHQASVVGFDNDPCSISDAGVNVEMIAPSKQHGLIGLLQNRQLIRKHLLTLIQDNKVDLVEFQDGYASLMPFKLPVPMVTRFSCSHSYYARVLGHRPNWGRAFIERLFIPRATAHASCSRFVGDVSAELFNLKPDSIRVLYNPIDLTEYPTEPSGQIEKGLILFVGSVYWVKGVFELIKAFDIVLERYSYAKLVFVGRDIPDRAHNSKSTVALLKATLSNRAQNHVEFVGHQSHDVVLDYLRRSEVFVLPSHNEGHSNAVGEAQASFKSIVLGDRAAAREVIQHRISGILVDPSDPKSIACGINEILSDPALRDSMGLAARAAVEKRFSLDTLMPQNLEFYTDALSSWASRATRR